MDLDTLEPGVDFVEVIERAVRSCDALIALIGKQWLVVTDEQGQRRLDNEEDFVRLEIQTALVRNIRVIPALVGGAAMPRAQMLPESLNKLARRHAHEISDKRFHADVDALIHVLDKIVTQSARVQPEAPPPEEETLPRVQKPEGMVLVPKGPFLYGDERVRIEIAYHFWTDTLPVTNEQYREFISAYGYGSRTYWTEEGWNWKIENNIEKPEYWHDSKWNKPDHPVVGVSFYEAEAYAKWAGKRVPSEQEWEKAARGTDGRNYPWGDGFDENKCNCSRSGIGHTSLVTKYVNGISPYGCYDMAGNVWEWTSSRFDDSRRHGVLRGGSWNSGPYSVRSANRTRFLPTLRDDFIGFRCTQNV